MAQKKETLAKVLNEVGLSEGLQICTAAGALAAAIANKVGIEATGGNLIEPGLRAGDILLIENSAAAEKEVTFAAGESPPSLRKGEGTVVIKLPEKTITMIVLETARHFDKSGDVVMTFTAGTAGNLAVVRVKKQ